MVLIVPWKNITKLVKSKQSVSAIFAPDRVADLAIFADVTPMLTKLKRTFFNQQLKCSQTMDEYGVQIESWGPFAEGRNDFFTNETLVAIGQKYHKSAAQVALRYLIQT